MSLQKIADRGVASLYQHWINKVGSQDGYWFQDEVLVDYVRIELGLELDEAKNYYSVDHKWTHPSLGQMIEDLRSLNGVHTITFYGPRFIRSIIVDFQKTEVVVMTICDINEIRCQAFKRMKWLCDLALIFELSKIEDYGKATLLTEEEIKKLPFDWLQISTLAISSLK